MRDYAQIARVSVRASRHIPFAGLPIPSAMMLTWLIYTMGFGMTSSDDEVCYEEDDEEDVDHASTPKNTEQAGPSVPPTVATSDSVTKKRPPAIHSFFTLPSKKSLRPAAKAAERSESSDTVCPLSPPRCVLHEVHLSYSCSCVIGV